MFGSIKLSLLPTPYFLYQFFAIALPTIAITIVVAFKGDSNKVSYNSYNCCCFKSWKSDRFKESNAEKKPWTNGKNYQKGSKERQPLLIKVRRVITIHIKSKMSNIGIKIGNSVLWVHQYYFLQLY